MLKLDAVSARVQHFIAFIYNITHLFCLSSQDINIDIDEDDIDTTVSVFRIFPIMKKIVLITVLFFFLLGNRPGC